MSVRVSFIGVYRFLDQICVAQYSPKGDTNDSIAVKSVISSPNVFVEPGRRYTNEGDVCCVHFVADDSNRVYTVVTDKQYPARVAFALLDEVQSKFLTKVGEKSLSAKEDTLSRTMRSSFADICLKYDDVKNVDKLASVQGKVDAVKTKMEENISQMLANEETLESISANAENLNEQARMLANEEKLEGISANAENLNEQARVFQNRSTALRRNMRCKALKMWFLLAFVITIVLIIIIVPLAMYSKNAIKGKDRTAFRTSMPKPKKNEEPEEESKVSKKDLRAAKKEQKKAAMKNLKDTKSEQERMLQHVHIHAAEETPEGEPSSAEAPVS
ncbi:hypothetical protein JKP88DRAFT_263587 [Tribonema minus]|uniref:Uncharacterized protein n=1 Tax=Tribonema minus TaxID=303371 RepID=A0A835YU71_9STRA|nr:hypothetical protein JKP88DRAFT_263587 [Tribonema minus]